ncbi:hypothetical protein SISNIDRAFT_465065 [Sistotremastrum niveocremeum HHB9708]|uniref:DUF6532 domain-containing protein n=1 Tax=Sistotremastrum niveocremeum HHB9708 TaxID=1314777 RepID=A0A164W7A7_9AGAM|nr:hypothetical protein SISNIDRAFT_465065 [Sistotremastrum niveocremeum HHB9708]
MGRTTFSLYDYLPERSSIGIEQARENLNQAYAARLAADRDFKKNLVITDGMALYLYETRSNFRQDIKEAALQIVEDKYDLYNNHNTWPGQPPASHDTDLVRERVEHLLTNGNFLIRRDEGSNIYNFGHAALEETAFRAFWGKKGLARRLPEKFQVFPRMGLVLVATAVQCALMSYKGGGKAKLDFHARTFTPIYLKQLAALEYLEADALKGPRLERMRTRWSTIFFERARVDPGLKYLPDMTEVGVNTDDDDTS